MTHSDGNMQMPE